MLIVCVCGGKAQVEVMFFQFVSSFFGGRGAPVSSHKVWEVKFCHVSISDVQRVLRKVDPNES